MRFSSLYFRVKVYCTAVVALVAMAACNDIDCPLYNTVQAHFGFYNSSTKAKLNLTDTLTIKALGTDSVLYNKGIGHHTLMLPMSYTADADTLLWQWNSPTGASWIDTLIISKTNWLYSGSMDCSTMVFHHIKAITWCNDTASPKHTAKIDSVVIVKKEVTYEATEHIQVFISQ